MLMDNTHTPKRIGAAGTYQWGGVGCLQFSLSRSRPKDPQTTQHITLLDQLHSVTKRILDREVLSADELALIEPGSFLGGAHPGFQLLMIKVWCGWSNFLSRVIHLITAQWSSPVCDSYKALSRFKFQMKLVQLTGGESLFAISRFDKIAGRPVHFISANSLFNVDRVRPVNDSRHNPYST